MSAEKFTIYFYFCTELYFSMFILDKTQKNASKSYPQNIEALPKKFSLARRRCLIKYPKILQNMILKTSSNAA